jgi:hypothetical protein
MAMAAIMRNIENNGESVMKKLKMKGALAKISMKANVSANES